MTQGNASKPPKGGRGMPQKTAKEHEKMPKVRTPQNDAERIIQAYNRACGGCMRLDNQNNVDTAKTLVAVTGSAEDAINATTLYAGEFMERSFYGFATWYRRKYEHVKGQEKMPIEKEEVPKVAAPESSGLTNTAVASALALISEAVANTMSEQTLDRIQKNLIPQFEKFIRDNYGAINRDITIKVNGGEEHKIEGVIHGSFDTVLKYVKMDEPVFLVGAAGSGKNYLCKQIADALGMQFWFTNAVTQAYQITGFTDAMGRYQPTQFYKAFTEGGLFMLDEMDASIPEVLIILNAAIANRYFDFPAPIGRVEAHKDLRIVAAGNTFGHGADADYVGRNQLDAASLDRFAVVEIYYDAKVEEACARGNNALLSFCRAFRAATEKAGVHTVVSYRAINRMAKMLGIGMDVETVVRTGLVKSLCRDDLNAVIKDLGNYGQYSDALNKIARSL